MATQDQAVLIERIDGRTALMADKLEIVVNSIDKLNQAVFTGNGHDSLMTRMSVLEQRLDVQVTQCGECKRLIVSQAETIQKTSGKPADVSAVLIEQQAEVVKTTITERFKFRKDVAALIIGLVTAIALELVHIIQTASSTIKTP